MSILEVKNLKKNFGSLEVLKGIDFSLEKGEALAMIGASGSGKTTLGKIVAQKLGYLYFDVDDYIWKQNTDKKIPINTTFFMMIRINK